MFEVTLQPGASPSTVDAFCRTLEQLYATPILSHRSGRYLVTVDSTGEAGKDRADRVLAQLQGDPGVVEVVPYRVLAETGDCAEDGCLRDAECIVSWTCPCCDEHNAACYCHDHAEETTPAHDGPQD
jgi:hypothetical protein